MPDVRTADEPATGCRRPAARGGRRDPLGGAGRGRRLRRRRALVGGRGGVAAGRRLAVPGARRGDDRAAGGPPETDRREALTRRGARRTCAQVHPGRRQGGTAAGRRGLRRLARARSRLAAAAGERRRRARCKWTARSARSHSPGCRGPTGGSRTASGYGAGVTSPGWYHHLWSAPDRPIARWLTAVAGALRTRDLPVSSAHVIEAVRLAETLASLRGRPLAGLAEVTRRPGPCCATATRLRCASSPSELVVGERARAGRPRRADRAAGGRPASPTCRRLRLKREARGRSCIDLDLRKPLDLQRSVLFHRLRLLGVGWAGPAESDVRGTGTFRETWRLAWRPGAGRRRDRGRASGARPC